RHEKSGHVELDLDDARERALVDRGIVQYAEGAIVAPRPVDADVERDARLQAEVAVQHTIEDAGELLDPNLGEKSEGSHVDAEDGDVFRCMSGDGEQRPVAAECHQEVNVLTN